MEDNNYEKFLMSKNNIICEVNKDFLNLVGYSENELVGKTLIEVGKLLRTDSQVDLGDSEGDTRIIIFTKEIVPIEGIISCKTIDNGVGKIFSFKKDALQCANQSFNLANQLGASREDAVLILSYDNLIVINNNDKHLDFHKPPYNKKKNTLGKGIIEILPKKLYLLFDKIKSHVIDTGNPFYAKEIRLDIGSLGETYWDITLVAIPENEINKYLVLYISNKTEKILNRKALKQKNEELETIIRSMSDEIIIFDKEFNIDISNEKMEKNIADIALDHTSLRSLNNLDYLAEKFNMFDEDNQSIPYESYPFQRVARGEIVLNFIMKIISPGKVSYREVNGSPIYDENGVFKHGIMIYKDIDDRIYKEESRLVKTQKELLIKIVESMGLEYVRCNYPDLEIISLNNKAVDKLKKINNEIKSNDCPIGKPCFELYPLDVEMKLEDLELHLIKKGDCSHVDYQNYIVDGEERFFKTINEPIIGLNNKIVEMIFITIDITEEVQQRNKLEETLEMQNQIFATISHELKTPLSVIFSAAQLIERDLKEEKTNIDKDDINKKISIIKQNCYRFTKLINNIIDLSGMESGFYKLKFSNRNIVEVVEDIADSVRTYVENTGLRIIFDTEVEEKLMALDVDKMERIMLNLISNAVKFSPKGETIYINIEDKEDFVLITVRDCGMGIEAKYLNTIFDRYKKVDNSLFKNAEGSGLGLALVKTIVKSIGGEISVESELGKGSVFTIKLPVKILEKSEVIETIEDEGSRKEQLNIEFSDVYTK